MSPGPTVTVPSSVTATAGPVPANAAASIDSPEVMAAYAEKLPLRRLGKPEEVAALFAFLASEDAAFITGETVVIDGGQLTY